MQQAETKQVSHYFTDLAGNRWSLLCTLADAQMLSQHPAIEISPDMFADKDKAIALMQRLATETFLLLSIVVELTRRQRKGKTCQYENETINVEDDAVFCRLLEGETLDEASRAFLAGLANVTPKLVRRGLVEAIESFDDMIETAAAKIPAAVAEAKAQAIGS